MLYPDALVDNYANSNADAKEEKEEGEDAAPSGNE